MTCVLLQIDSSRGIDVAVEYNTTPKRANACSPVPGRFIAIYPRAFSKLFPGQDLTPVDKLAKGSTFETWIGKIDSAENNQQDGRKQTCQTELNGGNNSADKVHLAMLIHQDVKNIVQEEANKRGYTVSGFVETVLVNWLNSNSNKKNKIVKDNTNKVNHAAYKFGQLAAKEYEVFGTVSFEGYLFDIPSKKLTALRKKFISAYKFTEDVGKLFNDIPPTFYSTILNRRHYAWFFGGFCGIDWTTIRQ